MRTRCVFSTENDKSCTHLWYRRKQQRTGLPCRVRSSTRCHQKCTGLGLKCPVSTAGTVTFLWRQDSPMLTLGTGLICPESCPANCTLLDSSTQTSSFAHKRISPSYTPNLHNLLGWLMYPDKYSIYSASTALDASRCWNGCKALSNGSLLVLMVWIHNCEVGVPVDGGNNLPKTVCCVGVTDTVGSHYIIWRPTSKPPNRTCKSDIW